MFTTVSRKRGIFMALGLVVALFFGFTVISQIMSNNAETNVAPQTNTATTPQAQSGNVTQNSEGRDVYVISQGSTTQQAPSVSDKSSGGILDRFLDGHEAASKTSMLFRFAIIGAIVLMLGGKGFLAIYSHKRDTYSVIKDDITTTEEVILKLEALLSRTKDTDRKKVYEEQLRMANTRLTELMKLQLKNDKKFLR